MAIAATTVWELNASATASNVNGGGFNPSNAGMLANFAATSATGDSPVVTSASYNFVATDVGDWFYVKSGTNWTAGWYQVASVAANAATLSAAIGQAVQVVNGVYTANTVAGCATTASPTGGTATIDYSQSTAAILTGSDLDSDAAGTTITSAGAGFRPTMVGNLIHITSGSTFTAGWYEIATYVNTTTVTVDRDCTGTDPTAAGVFYVGGAMSMNSTLDDDLFEANTPGNITFVKNGSYTTGEAMSIAVNGTALLPIIIEGYNTLRGDAPLYTTSNQPTFVCGTNGFAWPGDFHIFRNIKVTSTNTTSGISIDNNSRIENFKVINSTTTANIPAISMLAGYGVAFAGEAISYRGRAISCGNDAGYVVDGVYAHDSNIGIRFTNSSVQINNCLVVDNVAQAVATTVAVTDGTFTGNTFVGATNKLGLGLNFITASTKNNVNNNIFWGFTTAVTHADTQKCGFDDYNDYYNNTNDVSASTQWQKGKHTVAIDPAFTSVAQLTGSTATTSGSVLTQSGGNFSTVTDNVDFVYIVSGTGITAGKYKITSHTTDTITLDIAPGTNATADKVWQVTTGHNFMPTGAI